VLDAVVSCQQRDCRFDVTLRHGDQGWEHYVDFWEVLTEEGELLGKRVLWHPHDDEQPFTRSLGGIAIPEGINAVRIRAHDSRHGTGSAIPVAIP